MFHRKYHYFQLLYSFFYINIKRHLVEKSFLATFVEPGLIHDMVLHDLHTEVLVSSYHMCTPCQSAACLPPIIIMYVLFFGFLQTNWTNMNSSLRTNLRRLSKSVAFLSVRGSRVKQCSFEHVMTKAGAAKVGKPELSLITNIIRQH